MKRASNERSHRDAETGGRRRAAPKKRPWGAKLAVVGARLPGRLCWRPVPLVTPTLAGAEPVAAAAAPANKLIFSGELVGHMTSLKLKCNGFSGYQIAVTGHVDTLTLTAL